MLVPLATGAVKPNRATTEVVTLQDVWAVMPNPVKIGAVMPLERGQ